MPLVSQLLSNGYYRNSFERYGDDYCEEILQYLSFSDKVKYESVSKQFKRTIFCKQNRLKIVYNKEDLRQYKDALINTLLDNDLTIPRNDSYFDLLLAKCKFITDVCIQLGFFDGTHNKYLSAQQILLAIANHCRYLVTLQFGSNYWVYHKQPDNVESGYKYLAEKRGNSLKTIKFSNLNYVSDKELILKLLPNIECVSRLGCDILLDDSISLPKLVSIKRLYGFGFPNNDLCKKFVEKYQKLKELEYYYDSNMWHSNSFMGNLKELRLEKLCIRSVNWFRPYFDISKIADSFNCFNSAKIKSLKLKFSHCEADLQLYAKLLYVINRRFMKLKFLKIQMKVCDPEGDLSVYQLRNCTELTQLNVDGIYGNISDNKFIDNIITHLRSIKFCKIDRQNIEIFPKERYVINEKPQ